MDGLYPRHPDDLKAHVELVVMRTCRLSVLREGCCDSIRSVQGVPYGKSSAAMGGFQTMID